MGRIARIELDYTNLFGDSITIDFLSNGEIYDRDTQSETFQDAYEIDPDKRLYSQVVMGFTGLNGTGKTTLLELIGVIIHRANKSFLSLRLDKDKLFNKLQFGGSNRISWRAYFLEGNSIFKQDVTLERIEDSWKYRNLFLREKSLDEVTDIKDLYVFDDTCPIEKDSFTIEVQDNLFDSLREEVEIEESMRPLVGAFDHSVGKVTNIDTLSSGAQRIAGYTQRIIDTLKTGGYLILDDIEMHWNIRLVRWLIDIFENKELNPNGACLIFSTHAVEVLDSIERHDAIYVLRYDGVKRDVERLSSLCDDQDTCIADAIKGNMFGCTAPNYFIIKDAEKYIKAAISKD